MNMFEKFLNIADAQASTTAELIGAEMATVASGVVDTIMEVLPAIFTVVIVVVSLLVGYRLFRRMVGR